MFLDAVSYDCVSESLVNFLQYSEQSTDYRQWETQFHDGRVGKTAQCSNKTAVLKSCKKPKKKIKPLRQAAIKNTKSEFSSYKRPVYSHYLSPRKHSPSVPLSVSHRPHQPSDRGGKKERERGMNRDESMSFHLFIYFPYKSANLFNIHIKVVITFAHIKIQTSTSNRP